MRVLTTIDTIWFIVVLPASLSLSWTSHISYDTVQRFCVLHQSTLC